MAVTHANRPRTEIAEERFLQTLAAMAEVRVAPADLDAPLYPETTLTGRVALALFEAQVSSRIMDYAARELRARGQGFYTIGSSGHEGNAVLGELLRPTDLGFLHYRSGGLVFRRLAKTPGETPIFDVLLSLCASSEDPVAGGRHKVWGSRRLHLPPQTSTIASHLPKAMGAAFALERAHHLDHNPGLPDDAIVFCSFGDASLNHSTSQGAINAALWAAYQHVPLPLLLVCEDNGLGISVNTPRGWVAASMQHRPGMAYFYADGTHIAQTYDTAQAAIHACRQRRQPVFLHLAVTRMFGHAGSDIETTYRTMAAIEAAEAADPLLTSARLLVDHGVATAAELRGIYREIRARIDACAREAERRPRLTSAAEIVAPLAPSEPDAVMAEARRTDYAAARTAVFGDNLPETTERPRHLAMLLNQGLADMMAKYPQVLVFGEDVARKGGVYHVTAGLAERFGGGRVFNTLLDEQSILGLAIGAAHLGLLPIPEIQFLAYYHNAEDQIRGEAATLQFFSRGQWRNPMLLRIASFAYQRGFGGHFHNDNSIAGLRDVPGVVLAAPARGDDAVHMLRTALALCIAEGRVVVFLEPIALYMQKDLYEPGDGGWMCHFPPPGEAIALGEGRVYHAQASDLTIITYANGVYLSLRAARKLAQAGINARVVDLRWLSPLNGDFIAREAQATGKVLVVDEGRQTGGVSEAIVTALVERGLGSISLRRVVGADSFVPLGDAWRHVLPSEDGIVAAASALMRQEDPCEH